jgi:hypothetical protein
MDRIDTDFIERSPETNLIYRRQAQSRRKQYLSAPQRSCACFASADKLFRRI